ncbi:hypothetical protein imdm_257 [gamma proteobacterium IMCC2047]|nr:hypothetical protein imdm_257 [gamma proteobacterium IMCC2047]
MNVLPPLQTGLSGISRGFENLQEIASDIAKAGTSKPDAIDTPAELTQSLVELQEQEQATLAAVKVVGETEQVLGTLLDVKV